MLIKYFCVSFAELNIAQVSTVDSFSSIEQAKAKTGYSKYWYDAKNATIYLGCTIEMYNLRGRPPTWKEVPLCQDQESVVLKHGEK